MNKKINTLCFIFIFLFLIGTVCAADSENETKLTQTNQNQELSTTTNTLAVSQVKQKVTLDAPDLKMYYKDGSKFKVTVKDKNKKPIKKSKVEFSINNQKYTKTTNDKGVAYLDINLKSGTYSILTKFVGTSKYQEQSKKSTITIKSTIKSSNFEKYYTNTEQYKATFYTKSGAIMKNTAVKFKLNNKLYTPKTNSYGIAKLSVSLKPGKYSILITNPKTLESVTRTITIKTLIETKDLTFNENTVGKFNVKILNSNGKAAASKKVTITLNGKIYSKITNKNGLVTLNINLKAGTYQITTAYSNLKNVNKIKINPVKISSFTHTTIIPSYVNVTVPIAFNYPGYTLKTGFNGIIKMPKNEIFNVQIKDKTYTFSTIKFSGIDSIVLEPKNSFLIPFDGTGVQINPDKSKFTKDGIIITRINDATQIEYKSKTKQNTELFGFYTGRGLQFSETLTYMEKDVRTAKITFKAMSFDETGLKYSVAKFYGKTIYDFNYKSYYEITGNNTDSIKFAKTQTPVTLSYFGNSIVGDIPKEDIMTKFEINGVEELEKQETISYGFDENYRANMGFEVLQTYTIINEKITKYLLESWMSKNATYINRFAVMDMYGMHLASLETAWIADVLADKSSNEFDVNWKRDKTLTIVGGINLEDTYLNILNSDMGMTVSGDENNSALFRLINSINLPNIEEYVLLKITENDADKIQNSLDNVFMSILDNNFSMVQIDDMFYIFSDSDKKSAIILNTSSGIASVILARNSVYKGSSSPTSKNYCGFCNLVEDTINGIKNTISKIQDLTSNKTHPLSRLLYYATSLFSKEFSGLKSLGMSMITTMALIQTTGTTYRNEIAEKEDWHELMDKITFTRPGYLQSKKVYNIPNKNSGYDFIEVKIKSDMSLDRENAIYISNKNTRQLTKEETYEYFSEDYWTPFSMPKKYWDESWNR